MHTLIIELQKKMTQDEIASIVGCSQSVISDLKNKKIKDVSYSLGKKLEELVKKQKRSLRRKSERISKSKHKDDPSINEAVENCS